MAIYWTNDTDPDTKPDHTTASILAILAAFRQYIALSISLDKISKIR